MLTNAQKKLLASLDTKKGREKTGLCLVEGRKMIETAGKAVQEVFDLGALNFHSRRDVATTETPQDVIGIANIPTWSMDDVRAAQTIVVLDHVQDPGNVGAMMRLCLGFRASMVLIESADPSSPKVVRASAGALFHVPWISCSPQEARTAIAALQRPIYRLEKRPNAKTEQVLQTKIPIVLLVGNEGAGITSFSDGTSVVIGHDAQLESLNVATALAIALHVRYV